LRRLLRRKRFLAGLVILVGVVLCGLEEGE